MKGEITTVMINAGENEKQPTSYEYLTAGEKTNAIWNSTSSDSDGIIYSGEFDDDVTTATAHFDNGNYGVKKVDAGEIKLGGKALSVASDVKVYLVDSDGNIEAITMSDVKTNSDNGYAYTLDDGEITNLFIIERDV